MTSELDGRCLQWDKVVLSLSLAHSLSLSPVATPIATTPVAINIAQTRVGSARLWVRTGMEARSCSECTLLCSLTGLRRTVYQFGGLRLCLMRAGETRRLFASSRSALLFPNACPSHRSHYRLAPPSWHFRQRVRPIHRQIRSWRHLHGVHLPCEPYIS
jgi:hypothetical protein